MGQFNISAVAAEDGLCAGCGTCVGVCISDAISIQADVAKGVLRPSVDEDKCVSCGLCSKSCPGFELDFELLTPQDRKDLPFHDPLIGGYSNIYVGHSNDANICFNGASGGLVSSFLIYLLRKKEITGAIVTRMSKREPLTAEVFIATSEEDVLSAQKSKYCPVPAGAIIKKLRTMEGRYAFVGLPCHIAGIRKAQKHIQELQARVTVLLGLFCSRTPTFNATLSLLRKRGIRREDIESIDYRGNGRPGFIRITLQNKEEIKIPHLAYDYWGHMFYKFFIPPRCYLCIDKVASLADLSFGDNWSPFDKWPYGSSSVIVRDPSCLSLLTEMQDKGLVSLHETDGKVLTKSQDLHNKCNIAPRMILWKLTGGKVPDYTGRQTNVGGSLSARTIVAVSDFTKVLITFRKRNFALLRLMAGFFWVEEKAKQNCRRLSRIAGQALGELRYIAVALLPTRTASTNKERTYKVLMMGGYGTRDIGDEAQPHADIINLKELIGQDCEIVMLSPNPEYTEEFHGQRSIRDLTELGRSAMNGIKYLLLNFRASIYSLLFLIGAYAQKRSIALRLWPDGRKVLDEIACCDIVFNAGGGNLNSIIPQELYKKTIIYLAADMLNKPIILSGQTMGPYTKWIDKRLARFSLNKVHMITFRDKETSHARLTEIGVNKPVMMDAADDAMTIPSIGEEAARQILLKEVGKQWYSLKSDLVAAMNLKGALSLFKKRGKISDISKECQLMAEIADAVVDKFNAKIVFVPTDFWPDVDDRNIHLNIIERVRNKHFVKMIHGEYDDCALKGLIGLFDVAIGSRYHFCVFAASMFVPFLGIASGIYQQTKLKGLADLCGLPQCFVEEDMELTTSRRVWPKVEWLINNRNYVNNKLHEVVPLLKKRSLYAVEETSKLLRRPT